MNTDIKKIVELDKTTKLIYNPKVIKNSDSRTKIVTILAKQGCTRIDIVTAPNTIKHTSGWWVNIHKEIYIKPINSIIKLPLLKVINIPLAPKKHFFKSRHELLSFTLIFPELPKGIQSFDLIESNLPDTELSSWLNIYGVSLETHHGSSNTSLYAYNNN